eukprot:TRINITY_DN2475_c0_g1_i1.p1 TRINITY_DN2475_c0_g1~~TRINITY_DN2475_c0_g1_i1.p1  ORF type:complete len:463 (+),score=98.75 TRINITY_DN2475_c0_g1_i1:118-1389(+)
MPNSHTNLFLKLFSYNLFACVQAFCVEIGDTLRRYVTEALLERTVDDKGAQSLVQVYMDRPLSTFSARITLSRVEEETDFVWPHLGRSETHTLREIQKMSLNAFSHTPEELITFARQILVDLGLVAEFDIPEEQLRHFLVRVRQKYHDDNPFHNWYHAFSVMHFAYIFLLTTKAHNYLRKLDVLGMMIGALCHDIDHPGYTNQFAINSASPLAVRYNDTSVLENHHAYEAFQILSLPQCNIFVNLNPKSKTEVRKVMISAILATDMAHHFKMCKRIENLDKNSPFDKNKAVDRQFLVNMITHSADLSGQVLEPKIAQIWEDRIGQEFQLQEKREQDLGLETAPFMQNLADEDTRMTQQVNFIDFVLLPLWKPVSRIFPSLQKCYENLLQNRDYYASKSKKHRKPSVLKLTGVDERKTVFHQRR